MRNNLPSEIYKVDWVLINELAIGKAPRNNKHIEILQNKGIKSIFSLCDVKEAEPPSIMEENFVCKRIVLPDHKVNRLLEISELEEAIIILEEIYKDKPVFVHCLAAIERSPLICMTWLILKKGLTQKQALQYMMEIHKGTCPMSQHLRVLEELIDRSKLNNA